MLFCIRYKTEHTQTLRNGSDGPPGPIYVLKLTSSSNKVDNIKSYMHQSWTRKLQKPLIVKKKKKGRVPPTKSCGTTSGVLRLIFKQQNEK